MIGSALALLALQASLPRAPQLPAPTGTYRLSAVTYYWTDSARAEAATPDSGDFRQVAATLWFPAEPAGGAPLPYLPEREWMLRGAAASGKPDAKDVAGLLARLPDAPTHALGGGRVDSRAGRVPMLLVSGGGGVSRHFYTALAEEFASRGWLVAVISHAYSSLDFFGGGGLHLTSLYWRDRDDELADALAGDARFVLDRLSALGTADPDRRFTGRLDTTRVAILGHSRGGTTVGRACSSDRRFKAAVVYDNIGPEPETELGLRQPMMTVRASWEAERAERLRAYLAKTGSRAYEVVVDSADHFSFTDLPLVDPTGHPSAASPDTVFRRILEVTRAFLDHELRGRRGGTRGVIARPGLDVRSFGRSAGDHPR